MKKSNNKKLPTSAEIDKSVDIIKRAAINSDLIEMACEIIKNAPETDEIFNLVYHLISRNNTYEFNVNAAVRIIKKYLDNDKVNPVVFHAFKNSGYKIQKSELIWKDITL
jgi:hypothetical protein